jgi:hypothetical protein
MKRYAALFAVVLTLLVAALPAFATRTVTITEDQINDSFRVNNPVGRRISNVSVDLQPDQAVVSATWSTRRESSAVVATYAPSVSNGRVSWTVVSITVNGQPASASLLTQINNSISASWYNYIRNQAGSGRITAVTVSDTDITFTIN